MCGIVGYVGPRVDGRALEVIMEGLARLEYRGYDSAGVALVVAWLTVSFQSFKVARAKPVLALRYE